MPGEEMMITKQHNTNLMIMQLIKLLFKNMPSGLPNKFTYKMKASHKSMLKNILTMFTMTTQIYIHGVQAKIISWEICQRKIKKYLILLNLILSSIPNSITQIHNSNPSILVPNMLYLSLEIKFILSTHQSYTSKYPNNI